MTSSSFFAEDVVVVKSLSSISEDDGCARAEEFLPGARSVTYSTQYKSACLPSSLRIMHVRAFTYANGDSCGWVFGECG